MTVKVPPPRLLGPNGLPISSTDFRPQNTKADPPKTGNAFGAWAGRDLTFATLPGGGVVAFDLSKLQTADFRNMRDHYQVNASLAVLSFMQHQSRFRIRNEDKAIQDFCDEQIHENWTLLNRAMSTSNWAGYSPNVLEWENDVQGRKVVLDKIKDLVPEECRVNWRLEEQWAPPGHVKPKAKVYDGIKQFPGTGWPIPVENSFWYPMLMENGDYYGRKLLRPAFQSWFFSLLVHLFANRYYERFGEPVPVGRAPFDDELEVSEGKRVRGNAWMLEVLKDLRNRSVIVLPNDHDIDGNGRPMYDYDIEYLESQMRGADFERYLTRLDEEVSIALFTPILLLRTADVGSYNLGEGHMQLYLWMLNAMNADRKQYIDRYILPNMVNYNFSPNAPRSKIVFEELDQQNSTMQKDILVELIKSGTVTVDLEQLGQQTGMTLKQVRQTLKPTGNGDAGGGNGSKSGSGSGNDNGLNNRETIVVHGMQAARDTVLEIKERVSGQVTNAFREERFGPDLKVSMGFYKRMLVALKADGVRSPEVTVKNLYEKMDRWLEEVVAIGQENFSGPDEFTTLFYQAFCATLAELVS
jgi:hypothetical protein